METNNNKGIKSSIGMIFFMSCMVYVMIYIITYGIISFRIEDYVDNIIKENYEHLQKVISYSTLVFLMYLIITSVVVGNTKREVTFYQFFIPVIIVACFNLTLLAFGDYVSYQYSYLISIAIIALSIPHHMAVVLNNWKLGVGLFIFFDVASGLQYYMVSHDNSNLLVVTILIVITLQAGLYWSRRTKME